MLHYKLNQGTYNALQGLAYRIADNAYMKERFGRENVLPELEKNHATITGLFDRLDSLGVPFWVQNDTIAFGDDWRRYKSAYLADWLSGRGVDCSAVSVR